MNAVLDRPEIVPPTPGEPRPKPNPKERPNRVLGWDDDDNKPVIPKVPKPRQGSVSMTDQDRKDYEDNKRTPKPTLPDKL